MTYKFTVRETFERTFYIEAESEAAAREEFEYTAISDLDEPGGEELIERTVVSIEAGAIYAE